MADSTLNADCRKRAIPQRRCGARANEHVAASKPRGGGDTARRNSEIILRISRARPGRRPVRLETRWSSARPGPCDSQNIFAVSSRCVSSSSRFRGSSVLVSPGPAASLGSRSLSTIGVRSRVCHAPIPAFGYRGSVSYTHLTLPTKA